MQSPIVFDHPLYLLLFPVVALLMVIIAKQSRAPLAADQRRQSLIVRLILVAGIVLAIAEPTWRILSNNLTAVFVVDSSDSMRPDQRAAAYRFLQKAIDSKGDGDSAGVVMFGKYPNLDVTPSNDPVLPSSYSAITGNATNIQSAVQAAEASFPSGAGKKVVLLTDGKENAGDLRAEIATLKARHIAVDIAPTGIADAAGSTPECGIDGVRMPALVDKDSPFPIRFVISSTVDQTAKLHVRHDGQSFSDQSVTLKPGKNVVELDGRETISGTHRYDAEISPAHDTLDQNNKAFAVTQVHDRPRVLYLADSASPGASSLAHALAQQGIDMDVKPPKNAPPDQTGWNAYDAVVLSDVSAAELSATQHNAIRESVKTFGIGLGMIGGVNSFGAGGYDGTPVEEALPVSMAIPEKQRIPSADIVIVVDASGSMAAQEDGVEKVQLAARAAVNLMKGLTSSDHVAVIAVTTEATLVVPLESPSQAALAATQVESLHAGGGGIYCHTGLLAAYNLLSTSHAPIKHVIMCADTSDSEEQPGSVAAATDAYKRQHITTTCYGIGSYTDSDVGFLKDVAKAGKGDFAAVEQASDLPALYKRDAQRIQRSQFVEKPFRPRYVASDPVLGGLAMSSAPPLLGYDVVTPKPGVAQPLTVPGDNDCLFAYWQYGLGRSFAFTSDDRAHWAAQWLGWPGYNRFWAQTIRWSLRSRSQAGLQAVADNENGTGHVVADAYSVGGGFVNNAPISATVVAPDQTTTTVTLQQTAPGRYESNFDADQTGVYVLFVRDGSRAGVSQTIELPIPYSPEFRLSPPNLPLLSAVSESTGGRFEKTPDDVYHGNKLWTTGVITLAPILLVLASLLFVLDIAWRRLGLRIKRRAPRQPKTAAEVGDTGVPLIAGQQPGGVAAAIDSPSPKAPPVINTPKVRETYENDITGQYLSRPVSRGGDDDDPFPFVVTKIKPPPPRSQSDD